MLVANVLQAEEILSARIRGMYLLLLVYVAEIYSYSAPMHNWLYLCLRYTQNSIWSLSANVLSVS